MAKTKRQPLVVPTGGEPYKPSRSAWVGAAISGPLLGITALPGALIGYLIGRKKRNDEIKRGYKTVEPPSFWNSGAAKGVVIGELVGTIAAIGVALIFGGEALLAATSIAAFATAAPGVFVVALGVLAGSMLFGLVKGGNSRKAEMVHEYVKAEHHHAEIAYNNGRIQGRGRERRIDKGAPEFLQQKEPEYFQRQEDMRRNQKIAIRHYDPAHAGNYR